MNNSQPLDTLMTQLGLSNADLVGASKEQLSFKMVQKGRKGKRLTPQMQDKILNALLMAKPDLKLRRRELFHYEPNETMLNAIQEALTLVRAGKIKYPQFIDKLLEGGVNHYAVDVAAHRITYYGASGEAHVEQGPVVHMNPAIRYEEAFLKAAITEAQKSLIDYPTFLKRIYASGITTYEVNVRNREIKYRGFGHMYKELIPDSNATDHDQKPKETSRDSQEATKKEKVKAKKPVKNTKRIRKTGKTIVKHRVKRRRR